MGLPAIISRPNGRSILFGEESEPLVIGSLMKYPDDIPAISKTLLPEHFANGDHRLMYETILELYAAGIKPEPGLVKMRIEQSQTNFPFHLLASAAVSITANANVYAAAIASASRRRELQLVIDKLSEDILDPACDPSDLAAECQSKMMSIVNAADNREPTRIAADELLGKHFDAVRYAVENLITEGLTILSGPPKLGKSWFMLQLALSVVNGKIAFGAYPTKVGEVLYYALEDTHRRLQSRLKKIRASWPDMETRGLTLDTEAKMLRHGFEASLRSWLTEHPAARLVIVDTLARVQPPRQKGANAYTDDYRDIRALKSIADEFSVAIVVVHHTRKMGDQDIFATMSGTQGLGGAADAMIVLQRERGRSDAVLHVTGRDVEEAEIALTWNKEAATWTAIGDATKVRLSKQAADILNYIERAGGTVRLQQLYDEFAHRTKKETLRWHLGKLVEVGELRSPERGLYCLPNPPTSPTNQRHQQDQQSKQEGDW